MDKLNEYTFEKGIVTPLGIKYGETYYTSSKCLENKWFELAEKVGEWSIPILTHPSNYEEIIVFDIALPVSQECPESSFTFEMKQVYYQKIQEMKKRYFEQKKPKKFD
ncbi:hypothetical protein [Paenibacillus sp. V4I5]|uniref:hypothetical protein n=1 Tax=Paenibacillus sp. V4I5 TaxID=3042306 RepID=UPI002791E53E|nr:hypothetical protein [Paenibacillus sp. V4I5]MDQ0914657.1 hypothetical protein [Paenibacillus sp. V4I5]